MRKYNIIDFTVKVVEHNRMNESAITLFYNSDSFVKYKIASDDYLAGGYFLFAYSLYVSFAFVVTFTRMLCDFF